MVGRREVVDWPVDLSLLSPCEVNRKILSSDFDVDPIPVKKLFWLVDSPPPPPPLPGKSTKSTDRKTESDCTERVAQRHVERLKMKPCLCHINQIKRRLLDNPCNSLVQLPVSAK